MNIVGKNLVIYRDFQLKIITISENIELIVGMLTL